MSYDRVISRHLKRTGVLLNCARCHGSSHLNCWRLASERKLNKTFNTKSDFRKTMSHLNGYVNLQNLRLSV